MYQDLEYTNLEDTLESDGMFEEPESWEAGDFEEENWLPESVADPFLGSFLGKAGPFSGILKGLAQKAAVAAGNAIAGPTGGRIASQIAQRVIRETEAGVDMEAGGDFEGDFEATGGDMETLQSMAHLAGLAAEAESAAQSDQFIGAIANLAGNLLPGLLGGLVGGDGEEEFPSYEGGYDGERDEFLPALLPIAQLAMPLISKGVRAIGKAFSRTKKTRKLIPTLPPIAAKAATSLAKQAQAGRQITPQRVAATVAQAASKTLASPPAVSNAVRTSKAVTNQVRQAAPVQPAYSPGAPMPSTYAYPGYRPRRRIIRPRYCVY